MIPKLHRVLMFEIGGGKSNIVHAHIFLFDYFVGDVFVELMQRELLGENAFQFKSKCLGHHTNSEQCTHPIWWQMQCLVDCRQLKNYFVYTKLICVCYSTFLLIPC